MHDPLGLIDKTVRTKYANAAATGRVTYKVCVK